VKPVTLQLLVGTGIPWRVQGY